MWKINSPFKGYSCYRHTRRPLKYEAFAAIRPDAGTGQLEIAWTVIIESRFTAQQDLVWVGEFRSSAEATAYMKEKGYYA